MNAQMKTKKEHARLNHMIVMGVTLALEFSRDFKQLTQESSRGLMSQYPYKERSERGNVVLE